MFLVDDHGLILGYARGERDDDKNIIVIRKTEPVDFVAPVRNIPNAGFFKQFPRSAFNGGLLSSEFR